MADDLRNGGTQSYCCRGFRPSKQLKRDPQLLYPEHLDSDPTSLAKRDLRTCASSGFLVGGMMLAATGPAGPVAALASIVSGEIVTVWCLLSGHEASSKKNVGFSGAVTRGRAAMLAAAAAGQGVLAPQKATKTTKTKTTKPTGGVKMYGRYPLVEYGTSTTCQTTYKCEYGFGFDQVCDNQRWALDNARRKFPGRMKERWRGSSHRHEHWYGSFGDRRPSNGGNRDRCEIDEFPLQSLKESRGGAQQALRALNGNENGRQGLDWQHWLSAVWEPCSTLLGYAPDITWEVPTGTLPATDPRRTAANSQVIAKYGFDSTSGLDACYATFTASNGVETPIPDHGFRVYKNDPLFVDWQWPTQAWNLDPMMMPASDFPTSVNSGQWKRGVIATSAPTSVNSGQWKQGPMATSAPPPEPRPPRGRNDQLDKHL